MGFASVLQQGHIDELSVTVVFRNNAQHAGIGNCRCNVVKSRGATPQKRPKGWPVSAHGGVTPLAKDYGHSLRDVSCPER
jgi:hypothetical protein